MGCLALALLTLAARELNAAELKTGDRFPDLAKLGLEGKLPDCTNKVVLIDVWASWCVSCREEHPVLVDLAKRGVLPIVGLNYKDHAPDLARVAVERAAAHTLRRQRAGLVRGGKSGQRRCRGPGSEDAVVSGAVFLDRDGTLIEEVGYLDRSDRVALYPFAADAIRAAVQRTFESGHKTTDLGGKLSTREMGDLIVGAL